MFIQTYFLNHGICEFNVKIDKFKIAKLTWKQMFKFKNV